MMYQMIKILKKSIH